MIAANAKPEREDALMYLNRKAPIEILKGTVIYGDGRPCQGLYLVLRGRIQVNEDIGAEALVADVYGPDQFFGECGLLGQNGSSGSALALDSVVLMLWSQAEIEDQVIRKPQLGLALVQMLAERCIGLQERMQAMALAKTPERVALGLIHFADSLGSPQPDGAVRVPALPHRVIADYVGTSREIVTAQMNRLRQQGFVNYSRKTIDVYRESLAEKLKVNYPAIANLV